MKKFKPVQIDRKTLAEFRLNPKLIGKIDYSMNTRYYRVLSKKGKTLGASVDPLQAAHFMIKGAEMWRIQL